MLPHQPSAWEALSPHALCSAVNVFLSSSSKTQSSRWVAPVTLRTLAFFLLTYHQHSMPSCHASCKLGPFVTSAFHFPVSTRRLLDFLPDISNEEGIHERKEEHQESQHQNAHDC